MSVSTATIALLLANAPVSAEAPAALDSGSPDTAVPTSAPIAAPAAAPVAGDTPPSPPADDTTDDTAVAQANADTENDGDAPEKEAGEIVVKARRRAIAADPLAGINAASFEAIQAIDKVVVAPVSGTYEKAVPKPIRNGLRNFLINLAEPVVFVNFLLQFKPGKAAETAGRFALNSTIGVAGLFDMAKRKPFHLPYRQNGFANSFGYHGIKNGPFLFVPILGPTTVRDLVGRVLDLSIIPAVVGRPFNRPAYGLGTGIVKSMNDRVEFDEQIMAARKTADPYAVTRDFYLKRRQAEIDALHSPEYRRRKGIADPVLPHILPHVPDGAAPGSPNAVPTTSVPSSTGMVPAAPAPEAPVPGTPALSPAP